MTINQELKRFEKSCQLLEGRINGIAVIVDPSEDDEFIAEAIAFRLFRIQERLMRSFFLNCCVKTRSPSNKRIYSKLRCGDWETAEEIIKAGNNFLDWGNPTRTRNLANLIFLDGFPINDVLLTKSSIITDLQRIRNFIAHDSREAAVSFTKVARSYLKTGDPVPASAGALLLYRKRESETITLRRIFDQMTELSEVVRNV